MNDHNKLCVGIDVSKAKLDVAFSDQQRGQRFPYTPAGIKQLLSCLEKLPVDLLCLEATGGLERTLVSTLQSRGYQVALVNPRQIRDFARARNQLAKTDQIDAAIIAQFGRLIQPRPTAIVEPSQQKLRDLTARRRQVSRMLVQEKNRLGTTIDKGIRRFIEQAIRLYEKQLRAITQQQQELIEADQRTHTKARIIASVPGLGPASVAILISELPELGSLNRQQIARLVGVAPTNRDSGTLRGKRTTGGGRTEVRNGLFMPIVVAKQHNPTIKAFYDRLLANGKPKLVALIAAMRKLLTILNVMIREGHLWNQHRQST